MPEKHLSSQFDSELNTVSSRVMELGGLVESQIQKAIQALYQFNADLAHQVIETEHRVNGMQLGVEVQGMVHRVKHRFSADLEKRALGLLQNWLILEVGGEQIREGKAMEWLQELFTRAVRE